MNRSILIVICDFLLVSLLAFSTVDINKTTKEGVPPQVKTTIATNQIDSRQDLAAVMRLALEQEHKGRELLLGEHP
jgi:Na+-transporting methylmalonyl-CoA/oxaloacetate decarboxylase gamma subunit